VGLEPARRYERARPGELVHIDVKKLGRIQGGAGKRVRSGGRHYTPTVTDATGARRKTVGWQFVHVAIDDATRLAYVELLDDETAITATGFLRRAVAFFTSHGMNVERVMTDNGGAYRSTLHALACRALGLRHLRTRAYRPQTNGKAERFIRTLLGGWAYAAIYGSTAERAAALGGWLFTYNHRRRHAGIGRQTPIKRLNNLLGTYT
jgi:transposase InsO family protein